MRILMSNLAQYVQPLNYGFYILLSAAASQQPSRTDLNMICVDESHLCSIEK